MDFNELTAVLVSDDADQMKLLIDEGFIDKDYIDPRDGTPVLCLAASLYSIGVALVLLDSGASVNSKDRSGATPLHYAIAHMQNSRYSSADKVNKAYLDAEAMVDLLLYYYGTGDDFNVQDDRGNTPLHVAALVNEPRIIKKLIAHGAWRHLETVNVDGHTALYLAVDNIQKMEEWYTVPEKHPINEDYERMWRRGARYNTPDFEVPIEITEYNTYQNITRTIGLLSTARSQYDTYVAAIAYLSRYLKDDIVRNIVDIPVMFCLERVESIKTPRKIFERLFSERRILAVDGVVRRILYPDDDIHSLPLAQRFDGEESKPYNW
jgi:hypothetical protein